MKRLIRLSLERVVEGGHWIPNHKGKCKYQHGHSYRIGISISGMHNSQEGIFIDFGDIKSLIDKFDHTLINNILKFPSAENMSRYLALKILRIRKEIIDVTVTVYETEKACATTTIINPRLNKEVEE